MTAPSPVLGAVQVLQNEPGKAVTSVTIGADEPVFAGHYRGFPIFPGVCVVECVHQSALATPPVPGAAPRLLGVESTRFRNPVYPGDTVVSELVWEQQDGAAWRCRAEVRTARGQAAQVRLRYEIGEN